MATIREIARQLNITETTVSYVLNGKHHKVSATTRQRVEETARSLNYAPNPAARALVAGRTGNIGFVSRSHENALYAALLHEVAIEVDRRGGNLVACVDRDQPEMRAQQRLLHARAVDGILAIPYALPELNDAQSPWMRRPLVLLLDNEDTPRSVPTVAFDDANGTAQVAEHLWELGHRHILFMQGLGRKGETSGIGARRLRFLKEHWVARGGEREAITVSAGRANAAGGRAAMHEALSNERRFTAVVAYNDQMAMGALTTLREAGLDVPGAVSLVGWNDLDDLGANLSPALTSVRTSPADLARTALDLLYWRISAVDSATNAVEHIVRVPVTLIPRTSTAGAPADPGRVN